MTHSRFIKIQSVLWALALTLAWGTPPQAGAATLNPPDSATAPAKNALPVSYPLSRVSTKPSPPIQAASPHQAPLVREDTRVVINVPSRMLWVYSGNKIVKYFPVGVGRVGFMTPVGHFNVIRKVQDPGWENPYKQKGAIRIAPGETNPLGTRWIGFHQKNGGEFGIHGTDNPSSVGKFSSHGCVRMRVPDAEVLFDMVDLGTSVEVVYQPVLIRRQNETIRVIVYGDRFQKGMPSADAVSAEILKQYPKALVDNSKLQAALKAPAEKPIDVAQLPLDKVSDLPNAEKPSTLKQDSLKSSANALPVEMKPLESVDSVNQF